MLITVLVLADEVVRVFDGNASLKKRQYRTITVPRNAPAHVLLVCIPATYQLTIRSIVHSYSPIHSLIHAPTYSFSRQLSWFSQSNE